MKNLLTINWLKNMNKKLFFQKLSTITLANITEKASEIEEPQTSAPCLSMNGLRLTNIIFPNHKNDAINLEFLCTNLTQKCELAYAEGEIIISNINNKITHVSPDSLQALSTTGGIMKGNINMGTTNTFINIPLPQNPTDILSLAYLRSAYVSLEEGSSFLDFEGKRNITDLADPQNPLDAINFRTLQRFIKNLNTDSLKAISIKGGIVKGKITLTNGSSIRGLTLPVCNEDAICLFSLKQTTFPLNGGTLFGPLTLTESATITGLIEPQNNGDIISLASLKKAIKTITAKDLKIVQLSGGSLTGDIKIKKVSGLIDPSNPSDIVNLSSCKKIVASKVLNTGDSLTGNLNAQSRYTLQNLRPAVFPSDILDFTSLQSLNFTLRQLQSTAIVASGFIMQGNINMNIRKTPPFNRIINLADPVAPDQAITLSYLRNNYLPFSGGIISNPMSLNNSLFVNSATSFNDTVIIGKSLLFNSHDPRDKINFISDLDPHYTIKVTGLKAPITTTSPVNLAYLKANFLMKTGGIISGTVSCLRDLIVSAPAQLNNISISGSLISFSRGKNKRMNLSGHTLNCVNNLSRAYDIINLESFSTITQRYLSQQGGRMTQDLDMGGYHLPHTPLPIQSHDCLPLQYLETNSYTLALFIKDPSFNNSYSLWQHSLLLQWDWIGVDYRTSYNAASFFKMADFSSYNVDGNTAMFLKQGYLYSISVDIKPASPILSSQPLNISVHHGNISSILNIFETQSEVDYKFAVLWAAQKNSNLSEFSDAVTMRLTPERPSILVSSLSWSFIALSTPL
ncbi:hypothetical protein [Candidatus Clavichlamydia salmonicola]|uniref:hypothetical protein n=1 Tax=Candidatus Clavichlamydia salmonicola TaxID=469812 RepID=UPI00189138F4|nr:hypothetical protein [Candidatus Clavichlamydia salmonicola]